MLLYGDLARYIPHGLFSGVSWAILEDQICQEVTALYVNATTTQITVTARPVVVLVIVQTIQLVGTVNVVRTELLGTLPNSNAEVIDVYKLQCVKTAEHLHKLTHKRSF